MCIRDSVETGEVYNDYSRDDSYERLYNMPWFATYFVELYELYGEEKYLIYACRILKEFYRRGGETHYAIEMPILSLTQGLKNCLLYTSWKNPACPDIQAGIFRRERERIFPVPGYLQPQWRMEG